METTIGPRKKFNREKSRKLLFSGFALFCCFVLSPFIGTFMRSLNIPFAFVYIVVVFCTNILPLIIIAFSFRDISPSLCVIVVFLATGVFRMIVEILLSPVPIALISTPAYIINIVLYSVLLSSIAVGVSLFDTRRYFSIGIIVIGMILYLVFIQKIFFTASGLV